MDGIVAMQSRIARIEGELAALAAPARPVVSSASTAAAAATTGGVTLNGAAFADVLARAQNATATGNTGSGPVDYGSIEATPERIRFATDLLARLGITATPENMRALVAWQQAEGTAATHNPLATTQRSEGATTFNYAGVKNYTSYEQGLAATVTTINNGRYEGILAALRTGTSATAVADAIARSPWGTGGLVSTILRR